MLKKMMLLFVLITISFASFSAESVVYRKITTIGCHHIDGTCYVILSGEPFGNTLPCPFKNLKEFRFDASTTNGKRTYASLFAAYLSKKYVDVYLDGCSTDGRPSILWYHIY